MTREPQLSYKISIKPPSHTTVRGYVFNNIKGYEVTAIYETFDAVPEWIRTDMNLLNIVGSAPTLGHRIGENHYVLVSLNERESHNELA